MNCHEIEEAIRTSEQDQRDIGKEYWALHAKLGQGYSNRHAQKKDMNKLSVLDAAIDEEQCIIDGLCKLLLKLSK